MVLLSSYDYPKGLHPTVAQHWVGQHHQFGDHLPEGDHLPHLPEGDGVFGGAFAEIDYSISGAAARPAPRDRSTISQGNFTRIH